MAASSYSETLKDGLFTTDRTVMRLTKHQTSINGTIEIRLADFLRVVS